MGLKEKIANIPLLKAEDIDLRIGQIDRNGKWLTLLLYKNARIDMQILDDVFGIFGWGRTHREVKGNLYCTVNLWDDENRQWIPKEDVGTESNTEAEKGEASDSFKRACVNVGIGRELYTAPFIFISGESVNIKDSNGKPVCKDRFVVTEINYTDDRKIRRLVIAKESYGKRDTVFEWEKTYLQRKESAEDRKKREVLVEAVQCALDKYAKAKGKTYKEALASAQKQFGFETLGTVPVEMLETILERVSARLSKGAAE